MLRGGHRAGQLSGDSARRTRNDAGPAAIVALLVVITTAWWWLPSPDVPVLNDEAMQKIGALAASLATGIQPAAFAMQLDTLTPYPPLSPATDDLARAVAACDAFASLETAARSRVAHRLWEVMNGGHLTATHLAQTLLDLQQTAAQAGCPADRIDALAQAGYAAARRASDQRHDWW